MHTFHTGARIPHRYGTVHIAERSDDDSRQIVAALISNDAAPFKPQDTESLMAMSSATLAKLSARYLAGTRAAEQAVPTGRDHSGPSVARRDRHSAEDFAPPSTLVVHAQRQGRDVAPIKAALAERARRAASAMAAAARSARPADIALNTAEQKLAAAFAPESSLDAWRRRKAR